MKLNLLIKLIFSFLLFVSAFAQAGTAPKCSAVLMFQKQEVEAKVTAIVKTILTYQMNSANGIQRDNAGFTEATRQINEIVANFPEMLEFYNSEMKRLSKKDSAVRREIKKVTDDQKIIEQKNVQIKNSIVVIDIDKNHHFIFKNKDGSFFVIGDSKEFIDFFNQQKNIQQVLTTKNRKAIAILKNDGSVITWGDKEFGGDSSQLDLTNVHSLFSTNSAFAALKNDGSVVAWGEKYNGGHSPILNRVKSIYSNGYAFAALKHDGSVVTWGDSYYGAKTSDIELSNVKSIFSTDFAFAALKNDGSVISWGVENAFNNPFLIELSEVKSISSTAFAFAALKNDGTVFAWGHADNGGTYSNVDLTNVHSIYSNKYAFAAIKNDRSVVTWGDIEWGGRSSHLNLTNVHSIYSTNLAFAALLVDGTVITWGNKGSGGDSSLVQNHLYDIVQIIELQTGSFIAVRKDGKYILWGQPIGQYQNQVLNFDMF